MSPLLLAKVTATSCIGRGMGALLEALQAERSGLAPCAFESVSLPTCIGEVPGVDAVSLPPHLQRYDCRNNRLALLGLMQDGFIQAVQARIRRWGPRRVGVFLGTSTSGILETELAYRHRDPDSGALPSRFDYAASHNSYSVVSFVRAFFGLEGPAAAISSACSSSAKVFGTARRMMACNLIDAAIVGGVDSLCLTTLYGFHSLQLTSPVPCRPFDAARAGISVAEAAAFALLERPSGTHAEDVMLLGVGESSDAYHMSSPHPQGVGAQRAMRAALRDAQLPPSAIDYINLHGTGTSSNDAAEAQAVAAVFGESLPCSSTKGATGHALGAAGALEAAICELSLRHGFMPAGLNVETLDRELGVRYLRHNAAAPIRRVLSNSFGFGGSNCALIFGTADARPDSQAKPATPVLEAYVSGIGLVGPGLSDWASASRVLAGLDDYVPAATVIPSCERLPAAERRRMGRVTRLAMAVGFAATAAAGADPAQLTSVFSASGGDGVNCHEICQTLASTDRALSPTRFHNSVHNAASGYWSIAAASTAPANVLCAYDASFAAGLLEALTQVALEQTSLLLVVYDADYPEPLRACRPISDAFGVAMVLSPQRAERSLARIAATFTEEAGDGLPVPALEALRRDIPAARSLPLLAALARREAAAVSIDYLDPLRLRIAVRPC